MVFQFKVASVKLDSVQQLLNGNTVMPYVPSAEQVRDQVKICEAPNERPREVGLWLCTRLLQNTIEEWQRYTSRANARFPATEKVSRELRKITLYWQLRGCHEIWTAYMALSDILGKGLSIAQFNSASGLMLPVSTLSVRLLVGRLVEDVPFLLMVDASADGALTMTDLLNNGVVLIASAALHPDSKDVIFINGVASFVHPSWGEGAKRADLLQSGLALSRDAGSTIAIGRSLREKERQDGSGGETHMQGPGWSNNPFQQQQQHALTITMNDPNFLLAPMVENTSSSSSHSQARFSQSCDADARQPLQTSANFQEEVPAFEMEGNNTNSSSETGDDDENASANGNSNNTGNAQRTRATSSSSSSSSGGGGGSRFSCGQGRESDDGRPTKSYRTNTAEVAGMSSSSSSFSSGGGAAAKERQHAISGGNNDSASRSNRPPRSAATTTAGGSSSLFSSAAGGGGGRRHRRQSRKGKTSDYESESPVRKVVDQLWQARWNLILQSKITQPPSRTTATGITEMELEQDDEEAAMNILATISLCNIPFKIIWKGVLFERSAASMDAYIRITERQDDNNDNNDDNDSGGGGGAAASGGGPYRYPPADFVICMVAHDGLRNPQAWVHYVQEARKEGVSLRLVVHQEPQKGAPELPTHPYFEVVSQPQDTQWGMPSVTKAGLVTLAQALKEHLQAKHFCLVSGRDFPLIPPILVQRYLEWNLGRRSQFSYWHGASSVTAGGKETHHDMAGRPHGAQPCLTMHAACILCRDHAEMLVEEWKNRGWGSEMDKSWQAFQNDTRYEFPDSTNNNNNNRVTTSHSDEMELITKLRDLLADKCRDGTFELKDEHVMNRLTTTFEKTNEESEHPDQFSSYKEVSEKIKAHRRKIAEPDGAIFFRKIDLKDAGDQIALAQDVCALKQ